MAGRRVLVAVDGSADSFHAAKFALKNVVEADKDEVVFLNTYPPVQIMYPGAGSDFVMPPDVFENLRKLAEKESCDLLKRYIALAEAASVARHRGVSMEGDARRCIVEEVDRRKVDLLVLGSRGLGLLKRTFMGSVSNHALNHANCPVLIVRRREDSDGKPSNTKTETGTVTETGTETEHRTGKRVALIAVDGSDVSAEAFRWSIKNFLRPEVDRLVLLKVQSIPTWGTYAEFVPSGLEEKIDARALEENRALLEGFAKEAISANFECTTDVVRGDARETIVWAADRHVADILIMGNSGHGAFSRLFLGSVSNYCSHHVACPLLVVKNSKKDQKDSAEVTAKP